MVCKLHEEETQDKIIETMLNRNKFLHLIEKVEKKIEMIFTKPAAGGTVYCTLNCHPTVVADL